MSTRRGRQHGHTAGHLPNFSYRIIEIMHDNRLLPYFREPYKLLEAAGLKQGQHVLDVGCGPGYFTIPAARLVGTKGVVYAVDVHPRAIERVQEKIAAEEITNVTPMLANAAETGLPDNSIDLAFLFGLRYIAGGLEGLLTELHRVLKPGGNLSFEKTRGSTEKMIAEVERAGFRYTQTKGRILVFERVE
ncbi:MAG: methyltransferase domain-containing protein [Methanomicrobia archaeon]|nr:methyltransferase domain-containing protein [Methanomicrobia archaeon]